MKSVEKEYINIIKENIKQIKTILLDIEKLLNDNIEELALREKKITKDLVKNYKEKYNKIDYKNVTYNRLKEIYFMIKLDFDYLLSYFKRFNKYIEFGIDEFKLQIKKEYRITYCDII